MREVIRVCCSRWIQFISIQFGWGQGDKCSLRMSKLGTTFKILLFYTTNTNNDDDDDDDDDVWKQNSTFSSAPSLIFFFLFFLRGMEPTMFFVWLVCLGFNLLLLFYKSMPQTQHLFQFLQASNLHQSMHANGARHLSLLPGTDSGFQSDGLERSGLRCSSPFFPWQPCFDFSTPLVNTQCQDGLTGNKWPVHYRLEIAALYESWPNYLIFPSKGFCCIQNLSLYSFTLWSILFTEFK